MIVMGSTIMVAGSLQGWVLLTLRSQITQNLGIEVTGLFQAAWALSFIYMGFVLDAMGKDYYPNLAEHVDDCKRIVQLMQEQVNVALVLVGPVIVGMIAFAPLIVDALYASTFRDAAPLIQWMGLGNLLKVASWPLGFVLLAKAHTGKFLALEIMWTTSFLCIAWLSEESMGLIAVGLAFLCAYTLHLFTLYWLSRTLTGFRYSRENIRLMLGYAALIGAVFFAAQNDTITGYLVGAFALILSSAYSYKKLARMIGKDPITLVKEKYVKKKSL
jgi:PST family polysaccharide transporter